MQIVIDIPEEEYKKAKWKTNGVRGLTKIESIIANGIPLPKGHGRLIDADDFLKFLQALTDNGAPYENIIELLEKVETIIEAEDKHENSI